MKDAVLKVLMIIATIPLCILLLLGTILGEYLVTLILGIPFLILGIIVLYIKNNLVKKEVS